MNMKEKLKIIFGYRKFFSSDECTIDSLIRIDDEEVGYICEGCILTDTIDTIDTVREGMADKNICPMIMKEEVKILR